MGIMQAFSARASVTKTAGLVMRRLSTPRVSRKRAFWDEN
jgi:hypothetical protein